MKTTRNNRVSICTLLILGIGNVTSPSNAVPGDNTRPQSGPFKPGSVLWIGATSFGCNLGSSNGVRKGDRLIIARKCSNGLMITGYGKVQEVVSTECIAQTVTSNGLAPCDLAVVVSSDLPNASLSRTDLETLSK